MCTSITTSGDLLLAKAAGGLSPFKNKFTEVKGVREQTCLLNTYSLALRVCNDKPTYESYKAI